jgi:hypothetical protein
MSISPKSFSIAAAALLAMTPWLASAQAPQPALTKMKDCLLIEDGYKERLDCYDAVVPPEPKANAKKAKNANECRFQKEQDQRLSCFNSFVDKKTPPPAPAKQANKKKTPPPPPQ